MKSGLLAGLYALKAIIGERGGAALRAAGRSSPTRTRRSARRPRRRTSAALAADSDVALVLECARANGDIVSSRKGILDLRLTRPRPGGPRRRRAREGPQRDPRGGPDRRGPARAQRPLAGRHRQRRGHRRRDAPQRRAPSAARSRSTSAATRRDGARGGRGRDPADRRARPRCPDTTVDVRADGPLVADGEARAQSGGWSSTRRPSRERSASRSPTRRPAAPPMPTRRPGWACPASTASARSAATTTRPAEYLERRLDRAADDAPGGPAARDRARPGGRRLARRARRARRWRPGARRTSGSDRAPAHLVGRAVRGGGRLQPRDRRRRLVLGRRHDRRRAGRAIAPPGRPGRPGARRARDHRARPWPRPASRSPTSCGPGCS